jgi:hypothetical protein
MVTEPLKWYDENADNPAWVKALAEVQRPQYEDRSFETSSYVE